MKRIKKFGVLQTAKVAAVIYFIIIAIFMIPIGIFTSLVGGAASDNPFFAFGGGLFFIFAPFLYAGIAFVTTAIGCLVYNLIAQWVGGIEVEIETAEPQGNSNYLDQGVQ